MTKIKSIDKNRAVIEFPNFCVRIFVKYKGSCCTEIRIWKLPPGGHFWSMFNLKNLFWAIYNSDAASVHGFFTPPPVTQANDTRYWLQVFTECIAECNKYEEIIDFLSDVERMIGGDFDATLRLTSDINKELKNK